MLIATADSRTLRVRRTSSNNARCTVVTGSPSTTIRSVHASWDSVCVNRGSGRMPSCRISGTGSCSPSYPIPSKYVAPYHRSAAHPVTAPYAGIRLPCSRIRCSTTELSTELGTYIPDEVCFQAGPRACFRVGPIVPSRVDPNRCDQVVGTLDTRGSRAWPHAARSRRVPNAATSAGCGQPPRGATCGQSPGPRNDGVVPDVWAPGRLRKRAQTTGTTPRSRRRYWVTR